MISSRLSVRRKCDFFHGLLRFRRIQFLPQGLTRPMNPNPGRVGREAKLVGHFLVAQTLDVAQEKRNPVFTRERRDETPDKVADRGSQSAACAST